VHLWKLIGEEKADIFVVKPWDPTKKEKHAVVYIPFFKLYMDCKNDTVSKRLPLGDKVIRKYRLFKDLPKSWIR
jgi:hypothetical protein